MHIKIPKMTMRERALRYPYDAPEGAFMITDGHCVSLPQQADFSGRAAVLSVGSNRAPVQLFQKFGAAHEILVTPVQILDCDIVHIANLAGYGAVPCAAFPSPRTIITLNIAWLTAVQLEMMHATESLGDAYDFVRWDLAKVRHLHPHPLTQLCGYASRKGALSVAGDIHTQGPFALEAISAEGRCFDVWDQQTALMAVYRRCTAYPYGFDSWLEQVQQDAGFRRNIADQIAAEAIMPQHCPWEAVPPDPELWINPPAA